MKSIYKVILIIAAASLTFPAVAGQKYRSYNYGLDGQGSSSDGYLYAYQYCSENPDGIGGSYVYGGAYIHWYIDDNTGVYEYEDYTGLDSCPDNGNNIVSGSSQSVTVSLGGYVVYADCTDQITNHGSSNNHYKYPGQKKPQNIRYLSKEHYTYDGYDGSCVITVTDPEGIKETFFNYAFAYAYNQFQNQNN